MEELNNPQSEILKKFIEKHDCCPIYMLCNKCHNTYDKK